MMERPGTNFKPTVTAVDGSSIKSGPFQMRRGSMAQKYSMVCDVTDGVMEWQLRPNETVRCGRRGVGKRGLTITYKPCLAPDAESEVKSTIV